MRSRQTALEQSCSEKERLTVTDQDQLDEAERTSNRKQLGDEMESGWWQLVAAVVKAIVQVERDAVQWALGCSAAVCWADHDVIMKESFGGGDKHTNVRGRVIIMIGMLGTYCVQFQMVVPSIILGELVAQLRQLVVHGRVLSTSKSVNIDPLYGHQCRVFEGSTIARSVCNAPTRI